MADPKKLADTDIAQWNEAESGYVATGEGHRLFVWDWGSGAPVLFLAGWAMNADLWGEVMLALSDQGLRTVAYDRRGHGRSSDTGQISYDLLADDLSAVLETTKLDGVTVIAHSGAAGEVIRYLSRHGSDRIARLVLVGAYGPCLLRRADNPDGLPHEALAELIRQTSWNIHGWIDDNAEPFAPGASRRTLDWLAAMVLGCSRRIIVDFNRVIAEADLRAEVAALALPITVIHGDRDASAPLDLTGRRFAALARDAEFVVYEGAAHGLMLTHGQRLAEDIAARMAQP